MGCVVLEDLFAVGLGFDIAGAYLLQPGDPTGGLAEPLRLKNPTTIVPGDRVTHLVYDVCTG